MQRQSFVFALAALFLAAPVSAQISESDIPLSNREIASRVVDRGQDFAVYENVMVQADGTPATNRFTMLENGLHYRENGEWRESEDVIEAFAGGAIARKGPNRAIFSEELNVEAVFDIEMSDGKRLRGGVRAIQATDFRSGETVRLGTVKPSVKAQLLPPNKILFASAFEGIEADLILVWKHNLFSHDMVIRERPQLPPEWNAANVRLEVITEFYVEGEPELRSNVYRAEGQPELRNDAVIHFGSMAMIMGKAFKVGEENAFELGALGTGGIPVVKEWHQAADGRRFLIESLSWAEASEGMKDLPVSRQAGNAMHESRVKAIAANAVARPAAEAKPVQMASTSYEPNGYLLDFVIVPDEGTPSSLLSGETYYVRTSYYNGSSVTFNPGTVIKFKTNAYLLVYGPVTFPATNQMMVSFTSRNDDTVGEVVPSNNGEPQSDGNPASHIASATLWLYYNTYNVTVRQARFSWAKNGVLRDRNSFDTASVTLTDCIFNNITNSGSAAFSGDTTYLTSARLKKCNVTSAGLTMTTECGPYVVANFAGLHQSDTGLTTQPPDTQAAVGPNLVMQMIHNHASNGKSGIAFFDKYTGTKKTVHAAPLDQFFATSVGTNSINYATNMFDPRVVYDHLSGRWLASAITKYPSGNTRTYAILAISKDSDPIGSGGTNWVSDRWVKHVIQFTTSGNDFDTLGFDANGVYVSLESLNNSSIELAAIPKSALLTNLNSTSIATNYMFSLAVSGNANAFTPISFDASTSDPQWLMYVDQTGIHYRLITWSGNIPSVSSSWSTLALPTNGVIVGLNTNAPQKGSSEKVETGIVGSRLTTPISRIINGTRYIWTCRSVMVNSTGGTNDVDRMAIDFIRITTGSTPSAANRLFFDTSTNSPMWYHFPSIAVNKSGDLLIGCSASSSNEYISAYYTARLGSSSTWTGLAPYHAGKQDFYGGGSFFRWGDYSATSVDPDGLRMWTIQEYAETRVGDPGTFGTRVMVISP